MPDNIVAALPTLWTSGSKVSIIGVKNLQPIPSLDFEKQNVYLSTSALEIKIYTLIASSFSVNTTTGHCQKVFLSVECRGDLYGSDVSD